MGRALPLLVLLALASCASTPPLTAGPGKGPLYVAVLPVAVEPGVVARAPETSTIRVLIGAAGPREALHDAILSGVVSEGYPVMMPDLLDHALALMDRDGGRPAPAAIAERLGVDAVLVSELRAFDASHMRTQHRVVVDLAVRLVGRDGHVLWQGENDPKVVVVRTYRADMDYRAYMDEAADSALATLP